MTNYQREVKSRFVSAMVDVMPDNMESWEKIDNATKITNKLYHAELQLSRWAECFCNGYTREIQRYEKYESYHNAMNEAIEKLEVQDDAKKERIANMLEKYNISVSFNEDPRGCIIKMTMPNGWTNSCDNKAVICW